MATLVSLVTSGSLLLSFPIAAGAQTASKPQLGTDNNAAAADAAGGLEEIVVTAQRRSENLAKTPVAVTVVSADTLEKLAIVTESDLPLAAPGLLVRASLSTNQINYVIRGQTVDAFSNSQPGVLPYFDEVQVSGAGSSSFYDMQSIQVLKGPQGTLFGRNATGGAVLLSSAKPTDTFGGYATVRSGDYDQRQFEGAINGPLVDDELLGRLAAFYQYRDGFQTDEADGTHPGQIRRFGVRGSLTFLPTDRIKNDLVVDFSHSGGISTALVPYSQPAGITPALPASAFYSPAYDSIIGVPGAWANYVATHPGTTLGGFGAYLPIQQARGPYSVFLNQTPYHDSNNIIVSNISTYDVASDMQIKNILGFTRVHSTDATDVDGTPYDIQKQLPGGIKNDIRQVSEELQLIGKTLDTKLAYVTGIYYSHEDTHSLLVSDLLSDLAFASVLTSDSDTTNKSYAAYAQGTYDLAELTHLQGLGVTTGFRYSYEEVDQFRRSDDATPTMGNINRLPTLTFSKPSWQFGLQEQLTPDWLLYGVTRRSFRSGGYNTTAPAIAGFGSAGGAAFDAEIATDGELGVKFQGIPGGVPTRVDVAVYTEHVKDTQRVVYAVSDGQLAGLTVNVPKATISGIEMDGQVNPVKWLKLGGSINYTDAKFGSQGVLVPGGLSGAPVQFGPYPDTPRLSGGLFGELNAPLNGQILGSFRTDLYEQSKTYFSSTNNTLTPGTELPSYGTVNFRIGLKAIDTGLSVSASLKNAFDKVYYVGGIPTANLYGSNQAIPGDRRTYLLEVRYDF